MVRSSTKHNKYSKSRDNTNKKNYKRQKKTSIKKTEEEHKTNKK